MIYGNGNGMCVPSSQANRLHLNPAANHHPDSYDDMELDFGPELFASLEKYLPPAVLNAERHLKVEYMMEILRRYYPDGQRIRTQRQREYRQKIIANYQAYIETCIPFMRHPSLSHHFYKPSRRTQSRDSGV